MHKNIIEIIKMINDIFFIILIIWSKLLNLFYTNHTVWSKNMKRLDENVTRHYYKTDKNPAGNFERPSFVHPLIAINGHILCAPCISTRYALRRIYYEGKYTIRALRTWLRRCRDSVAFEPCTRYLRKYTFLFAGLIYCRELHDSQLRMRRVRWRCEFRRNDEKD